MDGLDEYGWFGCISHDAILTQHTSPVPSVITTPTIQPPTYSSDIENFKKGIKRSLSDYKHFTKDERWKTFKNHLVSIAATHDLSEVLSSTYVPTSDPEILLFAEKQKFMFSVFTEHLQTGKSKKVLHQFQKDSDAQ